MKEVGPVISAIAAATENNVIGKGNQLLWHLPDDFKFFKKVTLGFPVIMGRKTFESMGKALPERKNLVVTSNQNFKAKDCMIFQNLEEALSYAKSIEKNEIFIIGGGEIYRQSMPVLQRIYLTRIHVELEGDTYFPEIDPKVFKLTQKFLHPKDEKHKYAFTFEIYDKLSD
ncbi:MAG: dihydrofolate reductase [Chitinophagaceae bacterium]|nr:MAG: dihydrofolate reductase [Chitinophagaceae bacterium]